MRKLNYSHSIGCALKKPLIRGLLLVYLLTPTYCFSQASVETIVDRLEQYKGSYPQEKVFVHLDRPYYTVGDNIWYKVYLVDAITHVQATPSTIVTVELLNPSDSLVSRQHIKIDKGELGPGLLHLTYFDSNAIPRCERLIFIATDLNLPKVGMSMPYSHYGPKQKASLSIKIHDSPDIGLFSNLSLSIIDNGMIKYDKGQRNISSYLLLESDIYGIISDPYDLMRGGVQKQFLLDLILLTKGWRRFNWKDILGEIDQPITYAPNSGFGVSGTITEKGKPDRPIKADVYLSVTGGTFEMQTTTTGEDGRFKFSEIEIPDSSSIIIQANRYKEKKKKKNSGPQGNRKVDIYIDPIDSVHFKKIRTRQIGTKTIDTRRLEDDIYIRNISERAQTEGIIIELEEVVITQKKKTENEQLGISQPLYSFPDNRVVIDSLVGALGNQTVFDIIRTRVAGAQIIGTPRVNQTVRFRGYRSLQLSTTAGFLVDGVEVDESFVNSLTIDQIKVIDVIKNLSRTSVYGEFGAGGIVAIYLRDRNTIRKNKSVNGIINMKHPGYYNARTFYVPNYDLHPNNQGLPDIRPTLYWNPSILTIDGKSAVTFYTGDRSSTYTAILQGITFDGSPVFETFGFEVK